MLFQKGVAMEAKPFSVGARIEHLQEDINKGLYGEYYSHPHLPVGEYQLSYRDGERGVYTFCMCPGGFVVPSCSEENTVVTNGMSEFSRNQKNANAALVVSVSPQDYGTHPLDGVRFQRLLERRAFELGGDYSAPAQDAGSFMNETAGLRLGKWRQAIVLVCEPRIFFSLSGFHQENDDRWFASSLIVNCLDLPRGTLF